MDPTPTVSGRRTLHCCSWWRPSSRPLTRLRLPIGHIDIWLWLHRCSVLALLALFLFPPALPGVAPSVLIGNGRQQALAARSAGVGASRAAAPLHPRSGERNAIVDQRHHLHPPLMVRMAAQRRRTSALPPAKNCPAAAVASGPECRDEQEPSSPRAVRDAVDLNLLAHRTAASRPRVPTRINVPHRCQHKRSVNNCCVSFCFERNPGGLGTYSCIGASARAPLTQIQRRRSLALPRRWGSYRSS